MIVTGMKEFENICKQKLYEDVYKKITNTCIKE
jgi:hypothetical protein